MFEQTRLKLTFWYLAIIMLISAMFSVVIYRVLVNEVLRFEQEQRVGIQRRLNEGECFDATGHIKPRPMHLSANAELVEEAKRRVFFALLLVNTGIFVFAGILGYMLAGRTLEPIQEMVEEQHRFISDASHELKTPLTALRSSFEVYLRTKKRTVKNADQVITESLDDVNKLQTLSESLLQLAQYQHPNGHTHFEELPMAQILQDAIKGVEPMAKKKKIVIESKLGEVNVYGNKYSLTDLFVILLDNAIKYSAEKQRIELEAGAVKGNVRVQLKDHGIGIEAKDVPHIFDRFYRADKARCKESAEGYGLGLSIAHKIVEHHQGQISVKSKIGEGTTFTVTLPTKKKKIV